MLTRAVRGHLTSLSQLHQGLSQSRTIQLELTWAVSEGAWPQWAEGIHKNVSSLRHWPCTD